jgi:hypothetical protein
MRSGAKSGLGTSVLLTMTKLFTAHRPVAREILPTKSSLCKCQQCLAQTGFAAGPGGRLPGWHPSPSWRPGLAPWRRLELSKVTLTCRCRTSPCILRRAPLAPWLQWPPRRYPLDGGVVAADQGAKALGRMRRSRSRRQAGETRSEEQLALTSGFGFSEYNSRSTECNVQMDWIFTGLGEHEVG